MRRSQQRGRKTELFSDLEAFQHRSTEANADGENWLLDLATQRSCGLTSETWWTGVEGERGVLTQGFKMSEFLRREVG